MFIKEFNLTSQYRKSNYNCKQKVIGFPRWLYKNTELRLRDDDW